MAENLGGDLEYGKQLDEEDLLAYFWSCQREAEAIQADYRDQWTDLYRLYSDGDGLQKSVRQTMRTQNKEPLALPYATGTINTIMGSDASDRKEVQFKGQDGSEDDDLAAQLYTHLVRTAMSKGNCHVQDGQNLHDMLCCGIGWSEKRLLIEKRPMRPIQERVPLEEMWWDPYAQMPDLSDRQYDFRERSWTKEKVQAKWGKKRDEVEDLLRDASAPRTKATASGKGYSGSGFTGGVIQATKKLKIYDFCYQRRMPRVVFYDPATGATEDVLEDVYLARLAEVERENKAAEEAFLREAEEYSLGGDTDPVTLAPLPPPEQPRKLALEEFERYDAPCYYRAWIAAKLAAKDGGVILEHKKQDVQNFPRTAVCGAPEKMPDEGRVEWSGPLRTIADTQRVINKAWRLWIEILERSVKGGGLFEVGALPDGMTAEKFSSNLSTPGRWSAVADGAISGQAIREFNSFSSPQGVVDFLQFAKSQVPELSQVSDALKGTESGDKATSLVTNLQQRNVMALNPYLEPMSQFRMQNGLVMAQIYFHHVPTSDIDKILGPMELPGITHEEAADEMTGQVQRDPKTLQPLMRPILDERGRPVTAGKWLKTIDPAGLDVIADTGQATPTQKQQVTQALVQTDALRTFQDAGAADIILPIFAKYLLAFDPVAAKEVSGKLEKRFNESEAVKTVEGMLQAFMGLPPESQQQVAMQMFQQLQAVQQPAQGGQSGEAPVQ